jgi:hypothetical protein
MLNNHKQNGCIKLQPKLSLTQNKILDLITEMLLHVHSLIQLK